MQRHHPGSSGPGTDEHQDSTHRRYRAEEDARRPRRQDFGGEALEDDDEWRASHGEAWPKRYRGDAGGYPRRLRDSWSERQSGPYRSASSGRSLSEDDYRQEARYYRSEPYTGVAGPRQDHRGKERETRAPQGPRPQHEDERGGS